MLSDDVREAELDRLWREQSTGLGFFTMLVWVLPVGILMWVAIIWMAWHLIALF